MNLKLENKKLIVIDDKIKSSDSLIKITTSTNSIVIGILELSNGSKKIIEFVKESEQSDCVVGRLLITENDLSYLSSAKFYVELLSSEFKCRSNIIPIKFDISSIKLDVKKRIADEYKEIMERLIQLEERYKHLLGNNVLTNLNIINIDNIEPGMIPVAIDSKGTFVAQRPFSNFIEEINGQRAANGAVVLDATMIKCTKSGKTVQVVLSETAEAIVSIKKLVDELGRTIKQLRTDLNNLDIKLSTHINNGIV